MVYCLDPKKMKLKDIVNAMNLRDEILSTRFNGFSNIKIEWEFKVMINCYNKRNNLLDLIILLMNNIWRIIQNLNIINIIIFIEKWIK